MSRAPRSLVVRAHAKINLTLHVLGRRDDGYHDLQTVFQSIALHDTLVVRRRRGPFAVTCMTDGVPVDRTNLVWRAASVLWEALGRDDEPRDVVASLEKRIPLQAGLGGGSSDGVAALLALARLWDAPFDRAALASLAARIGADGRYFLTGGTALGLRRGDDIHPLIDAPPLAVVLALPSFGVSTAEAYRWVDEAREGAVADDRRVAASAGRALDVGWPAGRLDVVNDFEAPVAHRFPLIERLRAMMMDLGAVAAAMTGSGSAVFGLFTAPGRASIAANRVERAGTRALVSSTLDRARFLRSSRPRPA
jgi:4-diphosphocytidyl-2-C-methyl-D-erythritol kinase